MTGQFQDRLSKRELAPGYLGGDALLTEQRKSREFWRKLAAARGIEI